MQDVIAEKSQADKAASQQAAEPVGQTEFPAAKAACVEAGSKRAAGSRNRIGVQNICTDLTGSESPSNDLAGKLAALRMAGLETSKVSRPLSPKVAKPGEPDKLQAPLWAGAPPARTTWKPNAAG
eukprot:gnl/TRDRNA2_/TRDRNA2_134430_c2_seq2.p1 gnl/TRDRNA2_/TRDRNA2_134430_c2~~gnl/TRDRNA2_/TRDRNA2_134430_c2_seq2.p1  ORF type:complete len:125 (+),score=27.51 gnl/TRDRNA2_/TRDRNA2_134430_c2_seq2:105-479(+)